MTCPTCHGRGYLKGPPETVCLDCADPMVLRAATSTAPPKRKVKDRTSGVKGARDNHVLAAGATDRRRPRRGVVTDD